MKGSKKPIVCLDAGHGFYSCDKTTPEFEDGSTIHEAEQNYPIMYRVAKYLEFNGMKVILTNDNIYKDKSVKDRVEVCNESNADIMISIRKNGINRKWQSYAKGIETYCYKFGGEGEKLARRIHNNLINDTKLYNRGVKEGNWDVIQMTKVPAVLLELGFMDYLEEAKHMKDRLWHDKYAKAITKGICEYFEMEITEFPYLSINELEYYKEQIIELEDKIARLQKELLDKDMRKDDPPINQEDK